MSQTPRQTPTPAVAVIIPTRNRVDLLVQCLRALDAQCFTDFEVVVVDDGSDVDIATGLAAVTVAGRPVRVLRRDDGGGAVRARIVGVEATDAPILAFTDSDCEPQPDWLGAAVARLGVDADLVAGKTDAMRPVAPMERSVVQTSPFLYPTCNLAVRRSAYDAVGGFDVDVARRLGFRFSARARGLGFGEDTIFGWTVARRFRAVWDDDMVVLHRVFPPDRGEWLSRSIQMGAFPMLVREVPEIRPYLVHGRNQISRRSRIGFYATAAAVLTRRPAVVAGVGTLWAAHRFRRTLVAAPLPVDRRVTALPMQLALDAVQGTMLMVGNIKARTFLH